MARLSDEEIGERLAALEGWERRGDAIAKRYEGDDFMWSVGMLNRLAPVAEDAENNYFRGGA